MIEVIKKQAVRFAADEILFVIVDLVGEYVACRRCAAGGGGGCATETEELPKTATQVRQGY